MNTKKHYKKWYSLSNITRFIGVSTILTSITFFLTNYFSIQNSRQEGMTDYLEAMSTLMIDRPLYLSKDQREEVTTHNHTQWLARALTLNMLRRLDGPLLLNDINRKGQLIKFLYESRLIGYCPSGSLKAIPNEEKCDPPIISLQDAEFDGESIHDSVQVLSGIDLNHAVLRGANLSGLDLSNAVFTDTQLQNAKLSSTILDGANLIGAYLQGANLKDAKISKANFKRAQLCGANFTGTKLDAATFEDTTYDNKTIFPSEFLPEDFPGLVRAEAGSPCTS